MSAKDFQLYGSVAAGLCGQPLHLSLPTNSVKLLAGRRAPGTAYIWIDPPWDLLKGGRVLASADDYPDPQDPEYEPKHLAWGDVVRPFLEGAILEGVAGHRDGSTEFSFVGALRLRSTYAGPTEDASWYDDWYARA